MKRDKDGGPAFPAFAELEGESVGIGLAPRYVPRGAHRGMTLREFFAAAALSGDLASQSEQLGYLANDTDDKVLRDRARLLWRMADAMLAERGR